MPTGVKKRVWVEEGRGGKKGTPSHEEKGGGTPSVEQGNLGKIPANSPVMAGAAGAGEVLPERMDDVDFWASQAGARGMRDLLEVGVQIQRKGKRVDGFFSS